MSLSPAVRPRIHEQKKIESFERINSIRETHVKKHVKKTCKRLVPSRLHELHESKFPFVSRIEFIRSTLLNLSAHVYGVPIAADVTGGRAEGERTTGRAPGSVPSQNSEPTRPVTEGYRRSRTWTVVFDMLKYAAGAGTEAEKRESGD